MFRKSKALASLLLVSLLTGTAVARTVFLLPNASSTTPLVTAFQPDSNSVISSFAVQTAASAVIAHPTLNKYYVLARSTTDTLLVVDGANFNNITKRISLGQGETMALSPDGRRLVIVGGSVFIIDTATDNLIATISDAGNSPNDVAMSLDSTRAFVLNSTQNRLTSIDLTNNTIAGSVSIPGVSTGVAVAPNGFLYVTAINRIFEIDGKTMLNRKEVQLNARPGKMVFTSDGKFGLTVNQTPVTGSSVLIDRKSTRLNSSHG